MGKKIVWFVVSCLMVLSLVVASCGGAEEEEVIGETGGEEASGAEIPKVGGMLVSSGADLGPIDPTTTQAIRIGHMQYTSSELIQGDWAKGPQGTHETNHDWGFLGDVTLLSGELAETWEFPDSETIIFNLHKGIYYQDRAPANGRELTADDVVWNIRMQFNYSGLWNSMTYPPDEPAEVTDRMLPGDPRRPTKVTALDRYTVEIKVPADSQAIMFLEIGDNLYTNPPECWTEDDGWQDWSEVVGSGPFLLADYVVGSTITYTKHTRYFEYDPLNPEYRMPYIDTLKLLIIPDRSSLLAAFRTGQLDVLRGFGAATIEEAEDVMVRCPDVQYTTRLTNGSVLAGRMDKPELPFDDLRVRQAMNLAVNQQEILDDYLEGKGVMLGYPYLPTPEYSKFYTPLEEMPEDVKMLFEYDPDRAIELLEDAGYPDGFTTTVDCSSASTDELSMLKAYLEKVGIILELQPMEAGAWFGMWAARSYEEMFYGPLTGLWAPFEQLCTKKGVYSNIAYIDDPYYVEVGEVIARDIVANPDNYFRTMKEEGIYELASAWGIWFPARYSYNMWWPWLQNYKGVNWAGWANTEDLYKYFWVDEDLKASMGY
jgi:peptide/nickel transport system substrate-binding protein